MDSKIQIRYEAAKLATKLPGTTIENFSQVAKTISDFIQGESDLPEVVDKSELLKTIASSLQFTHSCYPLNTECHGLDEEVYKGNNDTEN